MAITKCKECGGKLSTKADACPSCGARTKAVPGAGAKLVGSLATLILFLWLGAMLIGALTSTEKKDPAELVKELEAKCAASTKDLPKNMGDKKNFYDSCVAGGKAQFRAQGLIE